MEMKKTDPLYDVKSTFYRRDLSTPYRYRMHYVDALEIGFLVF